MIGPPWFKLGDMSEPSSIEQGQPGGVRKSFHPHTRKPTFSADSFEQNLELRAPKSTTIYDRMRSEDGEVGAVLLAIRQAISGADWTLDVQDVAPDVAEFVRSELGMPAPGQANSRRRRHGINIIGHIAEIAETQTWAGFAIFEKVYEVGPRNEGQPGRRETDDSDVYHLRKLAPRHPRTIHDIEVNEDGGLKAIWQNPRVGSELVAIDARDVVVYTHRKEGADWWGRSVLRTAYKHWLMKDVFMKLDAQAVERNSMGIPVGTYSDASQKDDLDQQLADYRSGANTFITVPLGCKVEFQGVSGATIDVTPKIEYHDKQISRSALAMYLNLGHDAGARSLGETFHDVFLDACQGAADAIAEVATEHVIRDLVELNFGAEEPYPSLKPGSLRASQGIGAEALKTLVDAGVVLPDDKLEEFMRSRYAMPERDVETTRGAPADSIKAPERDPAPGAAGPAAIPAAAAAPAAPGAVEASQGELPGLDELLGSLIEEHQKNRAKANR